MTDDLTGSRIGEYILHNKIGEGAFAEVFRGVNPDTGEARAFKIARREIQETDNPEKTRREWETKALMCVTGTNLRVDIDNDAFLAMQFASLKQVGEPVYPRVDAVLTLNGRTAIQMELLEGPTLRDLMQRGGVSYDIVLKLAQTLVRLEQTGHSHGDLKPENIVVCGGRVVLLDPGFFGKLRLANGSFQRVKVTTPQYYPLLEPDDMMAFGWILVELATGRNPLGINGRTFEPRLVRRDLAEKVADLNRGNIYYFDPVCELSSRTALGEKLASAPLRQIISKALGLELGIYLGEGPRYRDFAALEADLRQTVSPLTSFGDAAPGISSGPEDPEAREECFDCGKPVGSESFCPYCGVSRVAPPCPHCGKPVTRAKNQRDQLDRYAWNSRWDGRCGECGFEFATTTQIQTGHHTFFQGPLPAEFHLDQNDHSGQSIVRIRGMESVHMAFDDWDHQPVIEVQVRRATASNCHDEGLPEHSFITMTIGEWNTIFEQLQGPLKPLMERRPWSRDTT